MSLPCLWSPPEETQIAWVECSEDPIPLFLSEFNTRTKWQVAFRKISHISDYESWKMVVHCYQDCMHSKPRTASWSISGAGAGTGFLRHQQINTRLLCWMESRCRSLSYCIEIHTITWAKVTVFNLGKQIQFPNLPITTLRIIHLISEIIKPFSVVIRNVVEFVSELEMLIFEKCHLLTEFCPSQP